jgi:hypothetical protein
MRLIPYMKRFPPQLIIKLKPHFKFVEYERRGNIVLNQGGLANYVCFTMTGEFEIVKEDLHDVEA